MGDTETIDRGEGPAGPPRAPHLFVVIEASRPLAGGARYALGDVAEISIGRGTQRRAKRYLHDGKPRLELAIPDTSISTTHAKIARTPTGWLLEDQGSKNGVIVNGIEQRRCYLEDGDVFELGHTVLALRAALVTPAATPDDDDTPHASDPPGMATLLPALRHELAEARALASSARTAMLILGPTGTGKELCARAIHALSERAGSFVAVNCAAIPAALIESELFGHKKGAFSGASEDRRGLVASSSGGTLFLDEIGDLSLQAQAALLRVLQEREVRAVGATVTEPVDLRVVAATHRDLEHGVAKGTFREDLFARLAGHVVTLPSLDARREDLGVLVAALLPRVGGAPSFADDAARALVAYEWPRNIRELESCLQRACSLAAGGPITRAHLPPAVQRASFAAEPSDEPLDDEETARRASIEALLAEHGGNITEVARQLGALRQTVQKWIKRYRIDAHRYRS